MDKTQLVQLKNPLTGAYIIINKLTGNVVGTSKKIKKGVEVK